MTLKNAASCFYLSCRLVCTFADFRDRRTCNFRQAIHQNVTSSVAPSTLMVFFFTFNSIRIWDDGSLEIVNITKLDEGRYTCFAENNRGKANSTGVLEMTGKPLNCISLFQAQCLNSKPLMFVPALHYFCKPFYIFYF